MFGFIAFCFVAGFGYFIYILSPILFWIIFCFFGFVTCVVLNENSSNPNVGSHWSDGS